MRLSGWIVLLLLGSCQASGSSSTASGSGSSTVRKAPRIGTAGTKAGAVSLKDCHWSSDNLECSLLLYPGESFSSISYELLDSSDVKVGEGTLTVPPIIPDKKVSVAIASVGSTVALVNFFVR